MAPLKQHGSTLLKTRDRTIAATASCASHHTFARARKCRRSRKEVKCLTVHLQLAAFWCERVGCRRVGRPSCHATAIIITSIVDRLPLILSPCGVWKWSGMLVSDRLR